MQADDERPGWRFELGQRVRKISGSSWQGHVVGAYATELTPHGIVVKSEREHNAVQAYPQQAFEAVEEDK